MRLNKTYFYIYFLFKWRHAFVKWSFNDFQKRLKISQRILTKIIFVFWYLLKCFANHFVKYCHRGLSFALEGNRMMNLNSLSLVSRRWMGSLALFKTCFYKRFEEVLVKVNWRRVEMEDIIQCNKRRNPLHKRFPNVVAP